MRTLHLNLTKKWFDMILSGVKTEEYREIGRENEYWEKKLLQCHKDLGTPQSKSQCKKMQCQRCIFESNGGEFQKYDTITFSNGYSKNRRQFVIELRKISVHEGLEEWGARKRTLYFVMSLGDVLSSNCS